MDDSDHGSPAAGAAASGEGGEGGLAAQGGAPRWASAAEGGGEVGEDGDVDVSALLATMPLGDGDESDDGGDDDLPEFASAANRQLHEDILLKERELARAERNASEHKERITVMAAHVKQVRQELQHTQALLTTKTRELETEDHLKQLSEREIGRVRRDLRKLDEEATTIQDRLSSAQSDLHRGQERLEAFKEKMSFNQEQLEQWAVAAKQKEEDNAALDKYTKADSAKVKELTLELERLEQGVADRRRELEKEITETQARQIEVDKTAEDFRLLHAERQELVGKWQASIDAIRKRDQDVISASEGFADAKGRLLERRAAIKDLERRHQRQVAENKEFEVAIEARNRSQAAQREVYLAAQKKLEAFQDEVDLLKSELSKAASELAQVKVEAENATAAVEESKAALERSKARLTATQGRLDAASEHTGKVEAVAVHREGDLKAQEEALEGVMKALEALKESTFKQSQSLFKLRQAESNYIAEISGAQASSKNLSHKIHQLDQQALRQQELVYSAEFQIQQMERKVARAKGERSDEEKRLLQGRIDELNEELAEVAAEDKKLKEQCKSLQEEVKATARSEKELTQALADMQSKSDELMLKNRIAGTAFKGHVKAKEEAMVEHDVLKLEVRKLRDALSRTSDDLFSLENRKAQLEMSREERMREIAAHQEVQRANVRLAEEERRRLAADVNARRMRVDKLKAKYETVCSRFRGSDEDGAPKSQAYFVIQNAKKREELQRQGDELDAAVRRTEKEIKALVNTLKQLTVRNTEFRSSFHKADEKTPAGQQLKPLERQNRDITDAVFASKRELQRVAALLTEHQGKSADLQEQATTLEGQCKHLMATQSAVQEEVKAAQASEAIAARQAASLAAEVADTPGGEGMEAIVEAACTSEATENVLYTLEKLSQAFPQLQGGVSRLLAEVGAPSGEY